jgi:chorismate lyase / 3-hydroxybenzoate synthase
MRVCLQAAAAGGAANELVLFDAAHPTPRLSGADDVWCWRDDEIAVVAIHHPDSRAIAAVAEQAYCDAWQRLSAGGHTHWLRTWTYFDGIVDGDGDDERYRQFCMGRAAGLPADAGFPAATVIGSATQGFWLWVIAARSPGQRLENPRQTPAWQYPREYGPQSPGFSRALWWAPTGLLLVSGTSSVVGHATRHAGNAAAQLDETLANIEALVAHAVTECGVRLRAVSLRLYVQSASDAALLARCLVRWPEAAWAVHQGTVCRADLAVEIEGVFVAEA